MWIIQDEMWQVPAPVSVAAGENAIAEAAVLLSRGEFDRVSVLENGENIGVVLKQADDPGTLRQLKMLLSDPDWDLRWSLCGSVLCLYDLSETTFTVRNYARRRGIPIHLDGLHWECIHAREQYPGLKSYERIQLFSEKNDWIARCWMHNCLAHAVAEANGIPLSAAAEQTGDLSFSLSLPSETSVDYAAYHKALSPDVLGLFIRAFAGRLGKQIAVVYGNCHFHVLVRYLLCAPAFTEQYCLVVIPPVFDMEELGIEKISETLLAGSDLIIYQLIRHENLYGAQWSTDELLPRLPEKCVRICIPNTVFFGYFPQEGPRADTILKNPVNHVPMFCGDKFIDTVFRRYRSIWQTVDILRSPDFLTEEQVSRNLFRAFRMLEMQDLGCDIPMRDFVIREYRQQCLFTEPKHPCNIFFREMAERILRRLGLSEQIRNAEKLDREETLSTINRLFYPSVIKHLGLKFTRDSYYCDRRLTEQKLSFGEFIELYIRNTIAAESQGEEVTTE